MIELVKEKIAKVYVDRSLKHLDHKSFHFTNVFSKSYNLLIVMPEDETDFHKCHSVLSFLDDKKKNTTLLINDFRVSLLPSRFRYRVMEYTLEDINKLKLPGKKLADKLSSLEFNGVIDLNRKESLFCSYASNLVKSSLRIGFMKKDSDKFYNLQVANFEEDGDNSYKNFLNCLEMF